MDNGVQEPRFGKRSAKKKDVILVIIDDKNDFRIGHLRNSPMLEAVF
jgi:hypothetical protein